MTNNLTDVQIQAQQLLIDLERARINLLEESRQLKLQNCNNDANEWLIKKEIINQDITEVCRLKLGIIYNCF